MPVALLLASLLVGTSGCAGAPDRPETPTITGGTPVAATAALPPGVTVRIYQTRFDYADRVLELSVSNAGRAPLDLRSARFDSSRFTAPAGWSSGLRLEPGMTRDLRVRLASAAWLDLTLTPTGAPGAVTIDQAGSTPLLASADGLDWPLG